MFNEKLKERNKNNYLTTKENAWSIYRPESFNEIHNGVNYEIQPVFDTKDIDGNYWYKEMGFNWIKDYYLLDETGVLDLRFLQENDVISMNIKDDVKFIKLNSSNIRYAEFKSHKYQEELLPLPVRFEIEVDTNIKDAIDSLSSFVHYNKLLCEEAISFDFKNADNKLSQLKIKKILLSNGVPEDKIAFISKRFEPKNKVKFLQK